jgi:hypothetical protein
MTIIESLAAGPAVHVIAMRAAPLWVRDRRDDRPLRRYLGKRLNRLLALV